MGSQLPTLFKALNLVETYHYIFCQEIQGYTVSKESYAPCFWISRSAINHFPERRRWFECWIGVWSSVDASGMLLEENCHACWPSRQWRAKNGTISPEEDWPTRMNTPETFTFNHQQFSLLGSLKSQNSSIHFVSYNGAESDVKISLKQHQRFLNCTFGLSDKTMEYGME